MFHKPQVLPQKKQNEMGRVEEKEKKTLERRYRFSIQKDFVFHSQDK